MTRERLEWGEGLLLVGLSYLLLVSVGGYLVARLGVAGQGAFEILLVLGPALVWCRLGGVRLSTGLGLERPALPSLAGGLLVGAGGFYLVSAVLEPLQEAVMPLPPAVRDELRRRIVPVGGARPLWVDLTTLALLPALCEEVLFRGALLGALAPPTGSAGPRRLARPLAVAVTALLFGVYHGRLWLIAPTGTLGILLAMVTLRARSIAPAMLLHAVNNTLVVLLVRAGYDDPPSVRSRLGWLLATASGVAIVAGLRLAATGAAVSGVAHTNPARART